MSAEELQWFKSTYSGDEGGQCLEVAFTATGSSHKTAVHVRDSKNPAGPTLRVSPATWATFTAFATR
jgi:uncharacterized protein DUF397